METFFASPERSDEKDLKQQIRQSTSNDILKTMVETVDGMLAVLNANRQIVFANRNLLDSLDIENPETALGLRPGEALGCMHAKDMSGGCGTGKFCRSCGAAVAIVTSQQESRTSEQKCVITLKRKDEETDKAFLIKAVPFKLDGTPLTLLFINDITAAERSMALQRMFLHDIANISNALAAWASMLERGVELNNKDLNKLAARLNSEIMAQRALAQTNEDEYRPQKKRVSCRELFSDTIDVASKHIFMRDKEIEFNSPDIEVHTDPPLLQRILLNMLLNALEASEDEGADIKAWVEQEDDKVVFNVWNQKHIPEDVALRVFQYFFSTKGGTGRGLGTYSMKFFGEKVLGGKVGFESSEEKGTRFFLKLPQ